MLIPRQLLNLSGVASRDTTRPHLCGISLKRFPSGVAIAEATDGKRLIRATWDEPEKVTFPKTADVIPSRKPGFEFTLPTAAADTLEKTIPTKAGDSILNYAGVDEDCGNNTARFTTFDPDARQVHEITGCEGKFPNTNYVIETLWKEKGSIGLDASLLANTLKTWMAVAGKGSKDNPFAIRFEILHNGNKSMVRISSMNPDIDGRKVQATAWLCPVE